MTEYLYLSVKKKTKHSSKEPLNGDTKLIKTKINKTIYNNTTSLKLMRLLHVDDCWVRLKTIYNTIDLIEY